ncbi:MAG: hypothetical protein M1836_004476 [Candelina mexicana]|nr:MAG: hypothetical protein M1836_004476 [Candelina mexicana]
MEPVGFSASIITLVKTTGALLNICTAIDDAPAQVSDIIEDLQLLQEIIHQIQHAQLSSSSLSPSPSSPPAVVLKSVEQCNAKLLKLSTLLDGFDLSATSRRRRTWAAVKATIRKDKIESLRGALEAAKISLITARQLLADKRHHDGMVVFTSRFDDAEAHQQQAINSTLAVGTKVVDVKRSLSSLEAGTSHLVQKVDATVSDINTIKSRCETIGLQNEHIISNTIQASTQAADVKAHVLGIHSVVRRIEDNFTTEGYFRSCPAADFESSMSDIVKSALTSPEIQAAFRGVTMTSTLGASHDLPERSSNQEIANSGNSPRNQRPQGNISRRCVTKRSGYSRVYSCFLGTILYFTTVKTCRIPSNNGRSDVILWHDIETSITIVPAPWLLSRGVRLACTNSSQGPCYNLRVSPVVPTNALVFEFAASGNVEGMRTLFRKGLASPWDMDADGYTPLHFACDKAQFKLCKFLIECGADSNSANYFGWCVTQILLKIYSKIMKMYYIDFKHSTPLGMTGTAHTMLEEMAYVECTRLLVEQGHADVLVEDEDGWNAFMTRGFKSPSSLRWLLQHESILFDPNYCDRDGENVLFELAPYNAHFPAMTSLPIYEDVLSLITQLGCDINQGTPSHHQLPGFSALHLYLLYFRSKFPSIPFVEALLRYGADPHAITEAGDTPTSLALEWSNSFICWRQAIMRRLKASEGLYSFLMEELRRPNKLLCGGWTPDTLLALFMAEIDECPPVEVTQVQGRTIGLFAAVMNFRSTPESSNTNDRAFTSSLKNNHTTLLSESAGTIIDAAGNGPSTAHYQDRFENIESGHSSQLRAFLSLQAMMTNRGDVGGGIQDMLMSVMS